MSNPPTPPKSPSDQPFEIHFIFKGHFGKGYVASIETNNTKYTDIAEVLITGVPNVIRDLTEKIVE